MEGDGVPKVDGYSLVNTQDQELRARHEAEGSSTNAGGTDGDAEQNKNASSNKTEALLSVSQLILRRGLALLSAFLFLAIGLGFHIGFPIPEPTAQNGTNFTLTWTNVSTPTPVVPLDLTTSL